jgi:ribosome biogenesis protein Nip4
MISLIVMVIFPLSAQISNGGTPKSFTQEEVDEELVTEYIFDKPNIEALIEEDIERDSHGYNIRDAVAVPTDLNLINSGTWFNLDNGDRIWRLRIRIPEALSLEAYYNEFLIPYGAELFVYNDDGTEVFGAFTHRNNKPSGRMSTEMVQGDVLNFEYYEPQDQIGIGELSIMDLAYRYRDVIGITDPTINGAQSCEVDVTCSEGDFWGDQVNSVVRIRTRINGQFFWCSGTIMNNTAEDCRPLILTAMRNAIDENDSSSEFEMDQYRFYFAYQASNCDELSSIQGKTITGCSQIADSNDDGGASGSDFLLVELTSDIPIDYQAYYAGWDASEVLMNGGGVSIHHPSGDVKKISTFASSPTSAPWGIPDTHWSVNWVSTSNGHGVTENGSNGAPLFNMNGRLIGTLSGGISSCMEIQPDGQNLPDYFGKMSYHWSGNPNPMDEKLREVLDPSGLNTVIFNGSGNPCLATSIAEVKEFNFSISPNPGADIVLIKLGGHTDSFILEVIDMAGNTILSIESQYRASIMLDVSSLSSGVYFLKMITSQRLFSVNRLVVNH